MNNIYILALFFIVIIIVIAIKKVSSKKKTKENNYPYVKVDFLFTKAERSFLGVLNQAVKDEAQIFGKVRLADVMKVEKGIGNSKRQTAFNKIRAKHFDYVLCNPKDLSVLCVIELNDKSHNTKKAKEGDAFKVEACKASSIQLIQIKAKTTYKINEVRAEIQEHLPKENEVNIITEKRTIS